MVQLKLLDQDFEVEVDDRYLILYSNDDFCSSPKTLRFIGFEIYTFDNVFCGIKIRLEKLDDRKLESIILVDEYNYEIDLSSFVSSYI